MNAEDFTACSEIKLMVGFPTHIHQDFPNDIAMYSKRFATVLLLAHPRITILNWENPIKNSVTKAVDTSPEEDFMS